MPFIGGVDDETEGVEAGFELRCENERLLPATRPRAGVPRSRRRRRRRNLRRLRIAHAAVVSVRGAPSARG